MHEAPSIPPLDTPLRPGTLAVHPWATPEGRPRAHRTLNAPLFLSTQWEGADLPQLADHFANDPDRGFYTRFGHPTVRLGEEKLAMLEGADDALLFASGMGAVTTSLLAVLRSGDRVVAHNAIFAQTVQWLEHLRDHLGVRVEFVDARNLEQVETALGDGARVLYLETPSNPLVDVLDVRALAEAGRRHGALVFVDSTFAGPIVQRPLALGAHLSLQSASKSLAGHADVLAGCVAGDAELVDRIRQMRVLTGPSLDPHAAWLLMRGLQTLPLRVRAQSATAEAVARQLEACPAVSHLRYPFLDSHPGAEIARGQMDLGGTMLSFAFRGGIEDTRAFVRALRWIPLASSLGSVFTTLEVPDELDFTAEEMGERQAAYAMPSGLVRFSVGAEDVRDIQEDVARGLDAVARRHSSPATTSAERELTAV
jgi:cystathionine beta-lyase/cystathionine gamma-synthase